LKVFDPLQLRSLAGHARRRWCNYFAFSVPESPGDQLTIYVKPREDLLLSSALLGDEVIELQLRLDKATSAFPPRGKKLAYDRWHGVSNLGNSSAGKFLRIYVDVPDWKTATSRSDRTRVISTAFFAGLKMFEQATGHPFPGVDEFRTDSRA
jgi:hypothetical protein